MIPTKKSQVHFTNICLSCILTWKERWSYYLTHDSPGLYRKWDESGGESISSVVKLHSWMLLLPLTWQLHTSRQFSFQEFNLRWRCFSPIIVVRQFIDGNCVCWHYSRSYIGLSIKRRKRKKKTIFIMGGYLGSRKGFLVDIVVSHPDFPSGWTCSFPQLPGGRLLILLQIIPFLQGSTNVTSSAPSRLHSRMVNVMVKWDGVKQLETTLQGHSSSKVPCGTIQDLFCYCTTAHLLPLPKSASFTLWQMLIVGALPSKFLHTNSIPEMLPRQYNLWPRSSIPRGKNTCKY